MCTNPGEVNPADVSMGQCTVRNEWKTQMEGGQSLVCLKIPALARQATQGWRNRLIGIDPWV